jgi:signal-induced proliferation-associated 1 like protein 2
METLRGSVLEEGIPSTSRHNTARGLPPKDILEYVCPEININSLRLAAAGPKVKKDYSTFLKYYFIQIIAHFYICSAI